MSKVEPFFCPRYDAEMYQENETAHDAKFQVFSLISKIRLLYHFDDKIHIISIETQGITM